MANSPQIKSRQRVAAHGEVFTAEREVKAMWDLVADECDRIESRFLEPACGDEANDACRAAVKFILSRNILRSDALLEALSHRWGGIPNALSYFMSRFKIIPTLNIRIP